MIVWVCGRPRRQRPLFALHRVPPPPSHHPPSVVAGIKLTSIVPPILDPDLRSQPQHPNWNALRPPQPPLELVGPLVEAADALGALVQYR